MTVAKSVSSTDDVVATNSAPKGIAEEDTRIGLQKEKHGGESIQGEATARRSTGHCHQAARLIKALTEHTKIVRVTLTHEARLTLCEAKGLRIVRPKDDAPVTGKMEALVVPA
jgi:hypothetical protein